MAINTQFCSCIVLQQPVHPGPTRSIAPCHPAWRCNNDEVAARSWSPSGTARLHPTNSWRLMPGVHSNDLITIHFELNHPSRGPSAVAAGSRGMLSCFVVSSARAAVSCSTGELCCNLSKDISGVQLRHSSNRGLEISSFHSSLGSMVGPHSCTALYSGVSDAYVPTTPAVSFGASHRDTSPPGGPFLSFGKRTP